MKKLLLVLAALVSAAPVATGLQKDEVLVVYNEMFPGSKEIAEYYIARRRIPPENLLGVKTVLIEHMEREVYLSTIQKPIKAWLDGETVNRQSLLLLRKGIARWLRSVCPMKGLLASSVARPHNALRWRKASNSSVRRRNASSACLRSTTSALSSRLVAESSAVRSSTRCSNSSYALCNASSVLLRVVMSRKTTRRPVSCPWRARTGQSLRLTYNRSSPSPRPISARAF